MPKWHDESCVTIQKQISLTSKLLKKYPNSQYLKTQLLAASKQYKKMLKTKQKMFLNKMFDELENIKNKNPRGYFNIVKSLKSGSFDKNISDDSSFVSPQDWLSHFQSLLGPSVPSENDKDLSDYVEEHGDNFQTELDNKITKAEFLSCVSSLDNNKSTSFDKISNEMLKAAKLMLADPILSAFNSVLQNSIYPTQWSQDILTPLHKKK